MAKARDYDGPGRVHSALVRWIAPAILLSLLLHALLFSLARGVVVPGMSREFYDRIVPRSFRIERAEIDPALLEPEPADDRRAGLVPTPVRLPEERVALEEPAGTESGRPAVPPLQSPLLSDTSSPPATDFGATLDAARTAGAQSLIEDPSALREALLSEDSAPGDPPVAKAVSVDDIVGGPKAPPGATAGGREPGFSDLDELLARTGPLSPETAPILMPTDLLFDYDSDQLRPEALESLAKLGTLLQRNPRAGFRIEGHTDSFGSQAYNLDLSTRRAQSVKNWLVANMGLPIDNIATIGYGKSHLIAPASGTVEEQQINRRVEIVIRGAGPQ